MARKKKVLEIRIFREGDKYPSDHLLPMDSVDLAGAEHCAVMLMRDANIVLERAGSKYRVVHEEVNPESKEA